MFEKHGVPEIFGINVFSDDIMQQRLPKDIYKSLRKTIDSGKEMDITVANAVANAMKDWAIEKGATHFTHWFQPMTGVTAEKHDSFISPTADGRIIMEFSGKELIKGEPDLHLRPAATLHGTRLPMHSSRMAPFTYQQHSAPTAVRSSTRRHLSLSPWKL